MDNVKEKNIESHDCVEKDNTVLCDYSKIGFNKSHTMPYTMLATLEMKLKNKIKQS